LFRDSRINTIFEGSSEIMRLFIAREALDPHLKIGAPMLDTRRSWGQRAAAASGAALRYATWYPFQWLGGVRDAALLFSDLSPRLAGHVRWTARATHRLARALFHAMALHGPKLEREQMLLGRFVDIGTELFAITAACSRAHSLDTREAVELADYFARNARRKVERLFHGLHHHSDRAGYRIAQQVLNGDHRWLEAGMLE
jgi:hypothetical protein